SSSRCRKSRRSAKSRSKKRLRVAQADWLVVTGGRSIAALVLQPSLGIRQVGKDPDKHPPICRYRLGKAHQVSLRVDVHVGERLERAASVQASFGRNFEHVHHSKSGTLEALFEQHPETAARCALRPEFLQIVLHRLPTILASDDGVQIGGLLVN